MEIIKRIKRYNSEIIPIISLFSMFIFFVYSYWARVSNPIVDFGREVYIPSEILQGQILYKDILNIYGPLSYQINAFFYWLFGNNLNTLCMAGVINFLIITAVVYLLSRTVTTRLISWAISFIVMTNVIDHIFPYAYSAVYSTSTFLLSTLFCVYYIKSSNAKFIPVSFFLFGISLANKIDYLVFGILLFAIVLFFKPISRKYLIMSLISLLIVPIASFLLLMIQGATLQDFLNSVSLIIKHTTSVHTVQFYHKGGFFLEKKWVILNIYIFSIFILNFLILASIIYYSFLVISNKLITGLKYSRIIQISGIIIMLILLPKELVRIIASPVSLCWIAISTTVIFFVLCIKCFKRKDTLRDRILLFLCMASLVATMRSYFFINMSVGGSRVFLIPLIVNTVFLIDYVPDYFVKLNRNIWKSTCFIFLILIGIYYFIFWYDISEKFIKYPINSAKGTFIIPEKYAYTLDNTIEYMERSIPKTATVLVIPEGPIINYLTENRSDNKYYSLIPNYIEFLGENNIVNDLKNNPPNYVLVNNQDFSVYGNSVFGADYGISLYKFIKCNYKLEKEFGQEFNIKIYKKISD